MKTRLGSSARFTPSPPTDTPSTTARNSSAGQTGAYVTAGQRALSEVSEHGLDPCDAATTARWIASLNTELSRLPEIPERFEEEVDEIARVCLSNARSWLRVDPEPTFYALLALFEAKTAIARRDEGLDARNQLRLALGQLEQALSFIAEGGPVAMTRTSREILLWLRETLDLPQNCLAELLGVSLRRLQRWLSDTDRAEPHGAEAERLRTVASVVNQLRFSLTAGGIIAWFDMPNTHLQGEKPRALLAQPSAAALIVDAATELR
jgi:hypothetical protein